MFLPEALHMKCLIEADPGCYKPDNRRGAEPIWFTMGCAIRFRSHADDRRGKTS